MQPVSKEKEEPEGSQVISQQEQPIPQQAVQQVPPVNNQNSNAGSVSLN